jgi:hypothetical protein
MQTEKYGEMTILDIISIDRVSGDFKKISNSNGVRGFINKNESLNITERFYSNYEYNGKCEKFQRKF